MGLFVPQPGRAPWRRQRVLPAEQQAEIDVDQLIREAQQERRDLLSEADALELQSAAFRGQSESGLGGLHKTYAITTTTIALGTFALLVMAANWCLETMLFLDLGTPLPLAMLVATVSTAAYAGAGAMAVDKLRGDATSQITGAAILVGLLVIGVVLVPTLAKGRALEMVGGDIRASNATITTLTQFATASASQADALQLEVAKNELADLEARKELAQRVFTGLLALTLATEVLLAGYGFDVVRIRKARRQAKRAESLESDAANTRQDADAVDTGLYVDLANVAREYAVTIDRVGEIALRRLAAMQAFTVPKPTHTEPVATAQSIARPGQEDAQEWAASATTSAPSGRITRTESPITSVDAAGELQWDGAWA